MSSLAKMLIGETTTTGDVAPVMTGAPVLSNPQATGAKRKIPTTTPEKQKKLRNRLVSGILGRVHEDSRDAYVIPDNAQEITQLDASSEALPNLKTPEVPGEKIKNPYSGEEPLILPAASLVAPDVTPEAIWPLDPSQLPGADKGHAPQAAPAPTAPTPGAPPAAPGSNPVIDLVLGKSPEGAPAATPEMSTESALSRLPGIPSAASMVAADNTVGMGEVSLHQPLSEHRTSTGKEVMQAFAKFIKPSQLANK